jgi:cytochrome c biogenesis protein CcmG, thiol:disulfide interchange protein DsbE
VDSTAGGSGASFPPEGTARGSGAAPARASTSADSGTPPGGSSTSADPGTPPGGSSTSGDPGTSPGGSSTSGDSGTSPGGSSAAGSAEESSPQGREPVPAARRRRWPGRATAPRRVWLPATAALLAAVAVVVAVSAAGSRTSALRPAQSFTLAALGHPGQHVTLAAYPGRPVIVNFFASWCAPCRRETPLLAHFYRQHHDRVLIIGVDSADEAAAALAFVKADGVTYPVGSDPFPAPVTISYGVSQLPQTFLLNSRHQVVRHIIGDVTTAELSSWASSLARTGQG